MKPRDEIAKTISAFCNRFLLTGEDYFIVFGVIDKKTFPFNAPVHKRILPLETLFKESKVPSTEAFQFAVNELASKHLIPCPDSCYTIKSVRLNDFLYYNESNSLNVIVIHIKRFVLSSPIKFENDIYIRKNGQDKKTTYEEKYELFKKASPTYINNHKIYNIFFFFQLNNSEANKKVNCMAHKGMVSGNAYICPHCHSIYCNKCANILKLNGEKCWT